MDEVRAYRWTGAAFEPPAEPVLCSWCMGAGKYLETMMLGRRVHVGRHSIAVEYLLVICGGCGGTGKRTVVR